MGTKHIVWKVIAIIFAVFVIITAVSESIKQKNIDADLEPELEPVSGKILSGKEYNDSEITVTAPENKSCVVKLKTKSDKTRLTFYVRAGRTVTVGVPAEKLYVYFASGKTWYGEKHLFGAGTSYTKDDKIRDFTDQSWTYTLQLVSDGNFSQTRIDEDEFNE